VSTSAKKDRLVIFGTGDIAQIAAYYFERDGFADVAAFTVDGAYRDADEFEGRPLVDFENIVDRYSPADHRMFVALSYAQMNRLREAKVEQAKDAGYELASYVSPDCTYRSQFPPGENAFIFEDNTIQPFVRIGRNVTMWSGNHIGHHSMIEDHNFVSSHVVISGHCTIEPHCFLGVNATIAHGVTIAEGTLLGAGVVMSKNTEPNGVYVPPRPTKLDRSSDQIQL
jgi:sugar O-acyltransferase (sialic acid O-acetyltransferase NeuD family)